MKKLTITACLFMLFLNAFGQLPKTLSFQGYLTNDAGEPITNAALDVSFALFTTSSGGTAAWGPEPQTIAVDKGIFSTTLGGTEPLTVLSYDVPYFLEINVDGETLPRIPVTAGMYSLSTLNASNISSGTVALSRGGTGANDASTARTNLGLGSLSTQNAGSVSITGGSISGITGLAIADGGTGAGTASDARTNLGLVIGTNVQAYDADLTTYAGITPSTDVQSLLGAANNAAIRTSLGLGSASTQDASSISITGGTISGITDLAIADGGTGAGTAADARTNLGLVIGTDVQAYDVDLTTFAGISPTTDVQTMLGSANNAGIRSNIGLGSIATQDASSIAVTGGSISGITDLAIADGGTGAGTAGDARTNLGLAIGTNVQAYDAALDDISGLAVTDGNIIVGNGSNWVAESGATVRTSLGLSIGTDVQAYDDDLTDLADGTLSGSKVGSGIDATNITTGTLPDAQLESTVNVDSLSTTNGATIGDSLHVAGGMSVDGYTTLGDDTNAPAIKMKKLTGTTASTEGGEAAISHGLTASKILSISVIVEATSSFQIHPGYTNNADYQYNWYLTGTQVRIWNTSGNSANILSKPIRILMTYEE